MSYKPGWKSGRWSSLCDRCGFRYHSDALRTEWDGLKVCAPCWETRHPQDFVKVVPEKIVPPWVRDEPSDNIQTICYIWMRSGYADLGTADCALADNNVSPYLFLLDLSGQVAGV